MGVSRETDLLHRLVAHLSCLFSVRNSREEYSAWSLREEPAVCQHICDSTYCYLAEWKWSITR